MPATDPTQGERQHFPVQQIPLFERDKVPLDERRRLLAVLSMFGLIGAIWWAAVTLPGGELPFVSWVSVVAVFVASLVALIATWRRALRFAAGLLVACLWVAAVVPFVAGGYEAPTVPVMTTSVLLAAALVGLRAATILAAVSTVLLAAVWFLAPAGLYPDLGAELARSHNAADVELFLLGSLIALWWSWRLERQAREHAELAGNAQILETLREAVSSSRAGIAIVDTKAVVSYANRALLNMWGLESPSGAVGHSAFEFWADQDAAQLALLALAEGRETVQTLRGKRRDGSEFDVEISGSRIVGDDGHIDGYIGSFIDITGRSMAEHQVMVERERTRAIVESVLDIVIILDGKGTIIFENAAVQRVLGYRPGERIGHSITEYAHPDDVKQAGAAMAELMFDPQKLTRTVVRFRHKDGGWRWLDTFGRNLMHVPAIGGILGVGRDITEQREMQARLEASERLETVGRLAGGIAHDFNNLLTAILGNTELATQLPSSDPTLGRYLTGVMQAGERARDLTRKLLAFARREIAQPVVIDVRDRIDEARELLRRILGEDIHLQVETGGEALPVLIDPVHFEQIILNLAVNARDAMPSGGTFAVRGELVALGPVDSSFIGRIAPGPAVRLTVSDTGNGMPPDVLARIFEPFFTTKALGRGTGLGLSTTYGSVSQAGGSIRVTSQVGQGTTFEILLPRATGHVAERRPKDAVSTALVSSTVLIAEDDESVRGFLVEVLQSLGCRVLEAADGELGCAVVDAHAAEIDVLVTDIVMPNKNGLELARYFLAKRPGGRVLLVTGYSADPNVEEQAAEMGAVVLLKPFTVEQLKSIVRGLAGAARSRT